MIGGHLGSRVSALLDGQLSPEEAERAWAHVHSCHVCRDRVEREGWVKSRLAGLSFDVAAPATPAGLKGSLIGTSAPGDYLGPYADPYAEVGHRRRTMGLVAIGGGAVGAAMMGVLAFGVAPADAPSIDRRPPPAQITQGPRAPVSPYEPVSVSPTLTPKRHHHR